MRLDWAVGAVSRRFFIPCHNSMEPSTSAKDFPYELEQRYQKAHREDDDYCELIYECLYEEGIGRFIELSDGEFKKLIRKQYNYIKKIAREGFY
jgi:hypothetical protein